MRLSSILIVLFLCISNALFSQEDAYETALNNYYDKADLHFYSDKDSAYYYYDKINKLATENEDIENLIDALINKNWAANYHYDLALISNNLKTLDSIFLTEKSTIEKSPDKDYFNHTYLYSKGLQDYELKNYKKAIEIFKKLVTNIEEIPGALDTEESLGLYVGSNNFIGKMYSDEGKFKLAKEFHNVNLRSLKSKKDSNVEFSNTTYILLADVYQREGNFEQANSTILKVLDYYITVTKNSNRIVSSYQNIVSNHIKLQQLDSASFYLKEMKTTLTQDHPFWHRYHEASANIYESKNEYHLAEIELQKAIELIKIKWKNQPHNDIAEAYNKMGLLHAKFNKPNKAIENYNLALLQLDKNKNQSTINKTVVLKILKNKAHVLNTTANNSESLSSVNLAIHTLDALKPSFKNNADKLFLMDEAFPVFESGLEATYKLYQSTKQDSLIDTAFYYAEKSKSVLLLESLLSTKAKTFANIPKDVTEKEQVLKSQINHLEKKLNDSKNEVLEGELFQLRTDYRNLITTIETNYKTYYDLKYNSEVIPLKDLQMLLKPEDLLLSYFYGNDAIYTIAVTKNSKTIQQYKFDESLENEIISIYKMLNNPKSNLADLNNKTFKLYTELVAPNLKSNPENLIIVSDGLLNYIPFSSLNTNQNDYKYLIEDYSISYINSVTLMKQLSEKKPNNNEVLAFAPSFNNTSSTLLPLPNNDTEANDILNYFKGNTLISDQATLENFNSESSKYGILHFATHAILDDKTPEYSYLAFQPNDTNSNLLYVSDLYNLNLNTNLVTLSACESGIGNLKRGEGFMSLARGFYFSGASSISSTLWKINDASSLKIMDAFYKNLSQSKTKNLALQNAQLEYINTNKQNALVHPYYWSGFIISGNTSAVVSQSNWMWYMLGAVTLIVIGLAYKKRKKSN